jgi:hypothetical protein
MQNRIFTRILTRILMFFLCFYRRRFRPRQNSPLRSRGGQQNVYVTDGLINRAENLEVGGKSQFEDGLPPRAATLATLDRRPNRPAFHHLGPGPHRRPLFRGPPPPAQFNRRMGGLMENVQDMLTLAKSEVGALRELARNITDSGKELNLWEVLDAVNGTVRDNPESGIAKLMTRFYSNYLADENEPVLSERPVPGTYEKSLSSLIFLSFGIFLLNSVNEHITASAGSSSKARSLEDHDILLKLMTDHESLGRLFDDGRSMGNPAGTSMTINNYLRLVLNLMNIYSGEEAGRDVDCVWRLYCHQLNSQAQIGGMASTVARINSVGMKLVLEEIPGSAAVPAVFRSMINWKQLHCPEMFPKCEQ